MRREELLALLREYQVELDALTDEMVEEILARAAEGQDVEKAAKEVLAEKSAAIAAPIVNVTVAAALLGAGVKTIPEQRKKTLETKLLQSVWTKDGKSLRERLVGLQKAMEQAVQLAIGQARSKIKRLKQQARAFWELLRGKGSKAIPAQQARTIAAKQPSARQAAQPAKALSEAKLPKYLKRLESAARGLSGGDAKLFREYQTALKAARRELDKFEARRNEWKTPNQNLHGDYDLLVEAAEKLVKRTDTYAKAAMERAVEYAVKRRAQYYAERIARTDAARAWFDGFIARYENDETVAAYRWRLSSRHQYVPYDQCDVCADLDVGFGRGIYPKGKVPSIPRHPHCMCMLEAVSDWEVEKSAKFQPEWVRKYLDALPKEKQLALFGVEGLKAYRRGGDWQQLLRGWGGFGKPGSRFGKEDFAFQSTGKDGIIRAAGALNPDSKEAFEHAVRYYELVRHMKTDYKRIADNTGWKEEDIFRIKNYIFNDEHELFGGKSRFYPDYHMAQAWQRLIEGKAIRVSDRVLLQHEFMELKLVAGGMEQRLAHQATNKQYNYEKALREEADK